MGVMWKGRLGGGLDPFFESFNRSIDLDAGLGCSDIEGSIAWAKALGGAGVLRPGEVKKLVSALRNMYVEIASDGVGDREVEVEQVAVRDRSGDDLGAMPLFQLADRMVDEREYRAILPTADTASEGAG